MVEELQLHRALSSIPDEFHWFCDFTEVSEHSSQEPACSLGTSQRIEKSQVLLKLFAIDHDTLPWVKDQLIKQLSRCADCVKTFHEKKREMFIDMQRFSPSSIISPPAALTPVPQGI